jgi:uronate dehydrogenase
MAEEGSVTRFKSAIHRILITGAAGAIGSVVRHGIAGRYEHVRLMDVRPLDDLRPDESSIVANLLDIGRLDEAVAGIDSIVHLAGVPREAEWEKILPNNIEGTYNLFEAARKAGVRRLLFASSNHVIGFYRADHAIDAIAPVRPDSRYGVSKVFGEALGRLYADKHGIDVACLRIGSFRKEPENARQLSTWMSHDDMVRLVRACLDAPKFHFAVLYGVSANKRRKWWDDAQRQLGYVPQDDAEIFADRFAQAERRSVGDVFHGGENCAQEFTGRVEDID